MDFSGLIKQEARRLGFDLAGITSAEAIDSEHIEHLTKWLSVGFAGQMGYMGRNFDKRVNPGKLLEGARSVICVGLNYKLADSVKLSAQANSSAYGRIANFALYEDYHRFIKERLGRLVGFIDGLAGQGKFKFKICVDSVPLAERALAQRAGLGFIGRNRMLINPQSGLQILLGEIVTDLELAGDEPMADKCRNCDKCIRACPTHALDGEGRLDARKCVSYLTIEHKGSIDGSLARKIGGRLFGCDECVSACPYDANAPVCANKDFAIFAERQGVKLSEIQGWNEAEFEKWFGNSTLERSGLERLKRNATICRANQGARKMSSSPGVSQPE